MASERPLQQEAISCNSIKRDKNKNCDKESAVNYAIHKLPSDNKNITAKQNRDRLLRKKKNG